MEKNKVGFDEASDTPIETEQPKPNIRGKGSRKVSEQDYKDALDDLKLGEEGFVGEGKEKDIPDALKRGAYYHAERFSRKFEDFPKEMGEKYGEKIVPYLKDAWDEARKVTAQGPWFSTTQRRIEEKMPSSAPVKDVQGMLKDISPEEKKWMAVGEFLKGKEKVTKEELGKFLEENQIRVGEVIYEESPVGKVPENLIAWGEGPPGYTKFSQQTLPGGENYREILLTCHLKKKQSLML